MKTYLDANRVLSTPFDIVVEGQTGKLIAEEKAAKLAAFRAAGMTWWIESMWSAQDEELRSVLRQGPPHE
jgi:hypothetical protein